MQNQALYSYLQVCDSVLTFLLMKWCSSSNLRRQKAVFGMGYSPQQHSSMIQSYVHQYISNLPTANFSSWLWKVSWLISSHILQKNGTTSVLESIAVSLALICKIGNVIVFLLCLEIDTEFISGFLRQSLFLKDDRWFLKAFLHFFPSSFTSRFLNVQVVNLWDLSHSCHDKQEVCLFICWQKTRLLTSQICNFLIN